MAKETRGGAFDKARDKEREKKKALGTETRQSIGAQMVSRGEEPMAPGSIGELMTPSTFGREGPPIDEEDLNRRVTRNEGFLSSPETRDALLQFGVAMLATAGSGNIASNFGKSLGLAVTLPERRQEAQLALDESARKAELDEREMLLREKQLGLNEAKLGQELEQREARRALLATLKNADDNKLMEAAQEAMALGDDEGARIFLSMMKNSQEGSALTGEIKEYMFDVNQGYKGNMMQWRQDKYKVGVIDGIRQKILTSGMGSLTPDEKQVYDDAINADPLAKLLLGQSLTGTEAPPVASTTPTAPPSGTSGNVKFSIKPSGGNIL